MPVNQQLDHTAECWQQQQQHYDFIAFSLITETKAMRWNELKIKKEAAVVHWILIHMTCAPTVQSADIRSIAVWDFVDKQKHESFSDIDIDISFGILSSVQI